MDKSDDDLPTEAERYVMPSRFVESDSLEVQGFVTSALRDLHSAWSAGALRDPIHRDPSFLNRFDRSHLAALMSDFMDKILELPRVGCVR